MGIILSYPRGPSVIKRILQRGRRQHKRENQRCSSMRRTWLNVAGFEDERSGPWAKECGQPLQNGKDKEMDSFLKPSEGIHLLGPNFSPLGPILDS